MVKYPNKRIYGLIGPPRSGKSTVAKYLQESRDFASMAFADKIKEEYGIANEDFEAAKITGEIDRLRQELWDFSAQKKKNDPKYFIKLVIDEALKLEKSVIITDIRTEDEFNALFECLPADIIRRVYMVGESAATWESVGGGFSNYRIKGSKISRDFYCYQKNVRQRVRGIDNKRDGVYRFYRYLSDFFFREDLFDLCTVENREIIKAYLKQFYIIENEE